MKTTILFTLALLLPWATVSAQIQNHESITVTYTDDEDGRLVHATWTPVETADVTEVTLERDGNPIFYNAVVASAGEAVILLPPTAGNFSVMFTSKNGQTIVALDSVPLDSPELLTCEDPDPVICGEAKTIVYIPRGSAVGDFSTEFRGFPAGDYIATLKRDASNGQSSGILVQHFTLPDDRPVWMGEPLEGSTDRYYRLPFDGFSGFLEFESLDSHDLSGVTFILGNRVSPNRPVTPALFAGASSPIQLENFMGSHYLAVSAFDQDILVQVFLASSKGAQGQVVQAETLKAYSAMVIDLNNHNTHGQWIRVEGFDPAQKKTFAIPWGIIHQTGPIDWTIQSPK